MLMHVNPRQEQQVYHLHRSKARKFPYKYMASIADGMDQHTTNIPSVWHLSKAMSAMTTVGTHLVGAIIHSGQAQNGKEILGSFDYYQFPHDSNLTMTVLVDVLVKNGPKNMTCHLFFICSSTTA